MAIRSYKDLEVWKLSVSFVTEIYQQTKSFPHEEMYGLTGQMRRAAVSIPSNIAEGNAKRSTRDYIRFINIARGSIAELETQLVISQNLGYLSSDQTNQLGASLGQISRRLFFMRKKLDNYLIQTSRSAQFTQSGTNDPRPSSPDPDEDLPMAIFED